MRLGLIARADRRGLAAMTENVWRNMAPAKTVVVDMGRHRPFSAEPARFPGAQVVSYDDCLDGYDWSGFLEGLDAVYSAETPYDFGLLEQARRRGVKTVVHVMPEYDPWASDPKLQRPDVLALPTCWMAERYPGSPLLPVPIEPLAVAPGRWVLHPAGGAAARDRNGTRLFLAAARADRRLPWLVRAQEMRFAAPACVTVEEADLPTPTDVLAGAGVVVLPRRYAGLSLILQDAMAAGLPVLATDAPPYGPELHELARLPVSRTGHFTTYRGVTVTTYDAAPHAIARQARAALEPEVGAELALASRRWAGTHDWGALRPTWDAVLAP